MESGKSSSSRLDVATKAVSFNVLLQVLIPALCLYIAISCIYYAPSFSCSLLYNKFYSLLFSQLLLRVSSFTLNGIILRYVNAELLGVVNLR